MHCAPPRSDELAPVLGAHEGEMVRVNAERASEREWDRHIACKYLPKPWDLKTMRTYIEDVAATQARGLDDTFATCADLHDLATQCLEEALQVIGDRRVAHTPVHAQCVAAQAGRTTATRICTACIRNGLRLLPLIV